MIIVELIFSFLMALVDIGTGIYFVKYLYSIPGSKKLERRLEKKNGKKVFWILLSVIVLNIIYFIAY